jgi:hypothetical protein
MWDILSKSIIIILGGILLIFCSLGIDYQYKTQISEANYVGVFVDNEKIFDGKKAFVDISTGGMTTTITIYKQLFPWKRIGEVYSTKNIQVEPTY